jgi:anti-sigma regulatory factor (Ser/Thr protein kinase)
MHRSDFHHEVFFYADPDEFLSGTAPYLREGIEAGERALVAVGPERTAALQGELDGDADAVRFADMHALGRNPARIIPFWRDFLDAGEAGGSAVRGIGEPIWPGRTAHELDECRRHESLLNVAFDDARSFALLCPYDTKRLPDEELEAAARRHPFVSGVGPEGVEYAESEAADGTFAGSLPPRPNAAASLRFDRDDLARVRELVRGAAERAGLGPDRTPDLVTAASELAANSVAHGGGEGTIWVWCEADDLVIEVGDQGRIDEPLVGRHRPLPAQDGGRGLWIANLLCDLVQIRSDEAGTVVRLRAAMTRPCAWA